MSDGSRAPQDSAPLLAKTPPFNLLTPDIIEALAERVEACRFDAGERLIAQGDRSGALYIVSAGEVRVLVQDDAGGEHEVARAGDGVVMGEMSLLTHEPHTADVVADSEVAALRLKAADFDELARLYPEVIVVLTEILAERLGRAARDSLGGKHIGDYRIVRCVGRGGMASVYEALHVETGERVALKMMNHRLVFQAGARARFHREAKVLLEIDHPSVTRVTERFDAYRTSFLVMEFCDGPTLGDWSERRGAVEESVVRALLGQLAGALAHLHERGVVHRDLKPSNVLLTSAGQAKLSDFGLAKPGLGADTTLTQEGIVIGTPRYMAPELFEGVAAGPSGDLYSLGCIGLELLMGEPLFGARDLPSLIDDKARFEMPTANDVAAGISLELHQELRAMLDRDPLARTVDLAQIAQWAAPVRIAG